jgi:hypothetical protein
MNERTSLCTKKSVHAADVIGEYSLTRFLKLWAGPPRSESACFSRWIWYGIDAWKEYILGESVPTMWRAYRWITFRSGWNYPSTFKPFHSTVLTFEQLVHTWKSASHASFDFLLLCLVILFSLIF